MTNMLIGFLLVCFSVSSRVVSFSNQEDLSISTYYHIACIELHSDRQFLLDHTDDNALSAYQTFSSSKMTIDLCFRLCRRWIILIDANHTTCICLYTLNRLFEFSQYLGDISSLNHCSSNHLQIYSLTNDSYILPSLLSIYDWTFDGCYYLSGIPISHASLYLTGFNYTRALDLCRTKCQTIRSVNYFSFFLSINKYCYCLPIQLVATIVPTAVRKPLIHCSFLSYVNNGFKHSINYSQSNLNAMVKINVQRYCPVSFMFDRNLYACLKLFSFNPRKTFSKMNAEENCSPLFIKSYEQWNDLISFPFPFHRRIFISLHPNSTYPLKDRHSSQDDFYVVVYRTSSDQPSTVEFLPESSANILAFMLCTEEPLQTMPSDQMEMKSISNGKRISSIENFTCPESFVLFNNVCYYVHALFAYDIQHGEHICSEKYSNSHLVKYHSHEHSNVNTTRFLGRKFDDILLEVFYYRLEQTFIKEFKNQTNSKHWLRLLLGDTNDPNKCVLRYFIRTSGVFLTTHLCNLGGHPVCQCEPILKIQNGTETTTTTSSIESLTPGCDTNCTDLIADEDLPYNETNSDQTSPPVSKSANYRFLFMVITVSLIAIVSIAVIFLIRYAGRNRGFYSAYTTFLNPSRRRKQSSMVPTSIDTSNTLSVVYRRLNPIDDDNLQLLPNRTTTTTTLHENIIPEDDEDPVYATVNDK